MIVDCRWVLPAAAAGLPGRVQAADLDRLTRQLVQRTEEVLLPQQ